MPSTIKLHDATTTSMDSLFKTMNTNTAKKASNVVTEMIPQTEKNEDDRQAEIKTVTTSASKKSDPKDNDLAKVGVCFNVPRYVRDMWKTYFTTHGLTMTDGLIQAVNYLREQEEKGEVKLAAISVIKN